jgi:hypothetical protein
MTPVPSLRAGDVTWFGRFETLLAGRTWVLWSKGPSDRADDVVH